jgi:ketosteroid isomerase-like protein
MHLTEILEETVSEVDAFLTSVIARQVEADTALHNGDAGLRKAMWSTKEPVTLFGAVVSATGRDHVAPIFDSLASSFSNCSHFDVEVIAAGMSGDLAYTVSYEHTSVVIDGQPQSFVLRVTHIYRREDGDWKIVHRHGDRRPEEVDSGIRIAMKEHAEPAI